MAILLMLSITSINIYTYMAITKRIQVIFIISLLLNLLAFTLLFNETHNIVVFNLSWTLTGISSYLIILTTLIIPICILIDTRATLYYLIIELILIALFSTDNLLLFYILYEAILIPMFMLIAKFGKSYNRFYASKQFVIYTIAPGLVMLVGILYIWLTYNTLEIKYLSNITMTPYENFLLLIAFLLGFLVKVPVIPLHIWLPEAHTEASTSASVILAAIIIKLATYGFFKIILPITATSIIYLNSILIVIFTVSVIYSGLSTIKQLDLKKVIAYSSIAHMSFAMLGITCNSSIGLVATTVIMISHAFISGAMFTMVGQLYSYTLTRKIPIISGLNQVIPVASIFALIIMFANMSLPGFSGFIGEFILTLALAEYNLWLTIISCIIMFITTIYSLLLYTKVFYGQYFNTILIKDLSRKEFHIFVGYLIWIIIIGIHPEIITTIVDFNCSEIINNV